MKTTKRQHLQLNNFVAKGIERVNIEKLEDVNLLKKIENDIFLNKKELLSK